MKTAFWKADWFVGLLLSLLFLVLWPSNPMKVAERPLYDLGVRLASAEPSEQVAVIAIDDTSIANIGRWPWSRQVLAEMIDKLSGAGAKVIANTVLLLEPQRDPGLISIEKLLGFYGGSTLSHPPTGTDARLLGDLDTLGGSLRDAEESLNTDRKLAAAMGRAGNVVLGMPFVLRPPQGRPSGKLPPYVAASVLTNVHDEVDAYNDGNLPAASSELTPPTPELGAKAAAIGHLNDWLDVDGAVRMVPLVVQYYDDFFPSLALMAAALQRNLTVDDVEVRLGEGVRLGKLNIGTDGYLRMLPFFYGDRDGHSAFPVDSFYDVFAGKIPLSKYRGKVVLIGGTATGVGAFRPTPIDESMAPVLILAHTVSSILNEDFFTVPFWADGAGFGAMVLIALYLTVLLPRLKAGPAALVTGVLLLGLLGGELGLLTASGMWLQLVAPALLLITGHGLLTTKRFLLTERNKERVEADSAETNKMLGLAFQGQGQLDMAFDKFRKCPVDDALLDLLYNLALDYERKRQFNKAGAVYRYISGHNAGFRDVKSRLNRSDQLENTVMLGGGGGGTATSLIGADGTVEKPMLGRYQIEKELGKGAMGVVYLGKDPKINRTVAIKTMALSQEFEADELDEVKERFFREAETAGRLNHPMIVSIFDAGEEQDLAYIAMEFLEGKDLTVFTKADHLLPPIRVFDIVMKVGMALDFAHRQNVVHRDIKPANIMYQVENAKLKITDFGIARITDSSKTKTGMVLGTPSYMSPEQLAGKKVDGRSDLFSLGVMLFQMLTGQLPFQGDSMAALMFKIANESHPDPLSIRPELPPCIRSVLDKALCKDPGQRYQTGKEFALGVRQCALEMTGKKE
ncbi:CHASE2 domain-containing serine/threonine-protein kinase [Endothiovibrio diazotrophicus]